MRSRGAERREDERRREREREGERGFQGGGEGVFFLFESVPVIYVCVCVRARPLCVRPAAARPVKYPKAGRGERGEGR